MELRYLQAPVGRALYVRTILIIKLCLMLCKRRFPAYTVDAISVSSLFELFSMQANEEKSRFMLTCSHAPISAVLAGRPKVMIARFVFPPFRLL